MVVKNMRIKNKVPPDGGYGWIVVFAMALTNFIYIPLMHSFGLIFKETFKELNLSATKGSLIINLNSAFGMLAGLLNGALLKIFGYRKIAFIGAFLFTSGIVLTSFSETFEEFIVTYGMITSLGIVMSRSSYSLALNTFFVKNRNKAMGYSVAIQGFGPIILPLLITTLMKFHTAQGVTLILGGICAHTFIAAMLLQPVEWHLIRNEEVEDSDILMRKKNKKEVTHFGSESQFSILDEGLPSLQSVVVLQSDSKSGKTNFCSKFAKIFDLDLLKDPIFVNILMGSAFALFAEMNFAVLTPFILYDFGLNTDQIATFMSTSAVADIIFRFLAPYIGQYLDQPPRPMYLITLMLVIMSRFLLLLSTGFSFLLFVAVTLGISKGIRKVYMGLVIPSHVTLEKLPSAAGMEMMANGFCILIGGPLLGLVRDLTGSYRLCIVIMNFISFLTVIMWSVEGIITKVFKQKFPGNVSKEETVLLDNKSKH